MNPLYLNNQNSKKIVLIYNPQSDSQRFIDQFKKKPIEFKIFENSIEAINYTTQNEVDMLLIAEDAEPMNAEQTIEYLNSEEEFEGAICVVSQSQENGTTPAGHPIISEEVSPSQLKAILNLLENQISKEDQDEKCFSFDYLISISNGNNDFLKDTVEIFKTSVKKHLEELEKAKTDHDIEEISNIAHSMKPSFEMFNNNTGKDLCNKLTYEYTRYDVNELILNLKSEYNKLLVEIEDYMNTQKLT